MIMKNGENSTRLDMMITREGRVKNVVMKQQEKLDGLKKILPQTIQTIHIRINVAGSVKIAI